MNWLFNKNVVISGASSGIGKEITKILIQKYNCKVLGLARTKANLESFASELNSPLFSYYVMDVSKSENWKNLHAYLISSDFKIDILINNAGTMPPFDNFYHTTEEKTAQVFATNFFSATYGMRELLPLLKQSNSPAIINISSVGALSCMPGVSIYAASKSALKTFSETLSVELNHKVFVSTIMPGFVKTNLFVNKDNQKDIIEACDQKFIDHFCMKLNKMAKKIVKVIAKKRKRAVIGIDAKFLNIFYKLAPQTSGNVVGGIMKKSKLKTFDDIWNN